MAYRTNPNEDPLIIETMIDNTRRRNSLDERYKSYHYPRNKLEWWAIVDDWWVELLKIAERYVDMQTICPNFGDEKMYLVVERLKKERNNELAGFFEGVWHAAPDHGSIHTNKGWGVLCDLCSESYVLYENEGDEKS